MSNCCNKRSLSLLLFVSVFYFDTDARVTFDYQTIQPSSLVCVQCIFEAAAAPVLQQIDPTPCRNPSFFFLYPQFPNLFHPQLPVVAAAAAGRLMAQFLLTYPIIEAATHSQRNGTLSYYYYFRFSLSTTQPAAVGRSVESINQSIFS